MTEPKQKEQIYELACFAGAGGGLLGGKILGWHPVCAIEINKYRRKILMQRQNDGILPPFPIWDDIRTFKGAPWRGIVNLVSGGFPCQDISSAGKRVGISGNKSGLWKEMARIVREIRPKYVFVENTPELTGRGLDTVLADLASMGYDAKWCVLGACDAGAPHKRKRIWILATDPNQSGQYIQPFHEKMAGSSSIMADTSGERSREKNEISTGRNSTVSSNENVADASSERSQRLSISQIQQLQSSERNQWPSEPQLDRVAHGLANRVDRIQAIGDGQVPRVVALAWRILNSIDQEKVLKKKMKLRLKR